MLNHSNTTTESKSPEHTLTLSHSAIKIPAAWQAPLHADLEGIAQLETTETTIKLPSNQPEITFHNPSRKTKIIATLAPATERGAAPRDLLEAGVSVFRLNLGCISRASALNAVYAIRSISTELQRPVSLLLDTQLSTTPTTDLPGITESDWKDIYFGLECGVDWLGVAPGRNGDDIRQLRQFIVEQKRNNIGILARIEGPADSATLDEIIQDADGIVLAGGNLSGGQWGAAEMFSFWQSAVQKCVSARKLAVIATSADVDMVPALSTQPDALLIPVETNVGPDLSHSVQTLDGLIRQEESRNSCELPAAVTLMTEQDRTVAAAVQQAHEMKAEGIVVFTRTGNSAALCAALRPRQVRVFVFTPDTRLARRLRLHYALETIVLPFSALPQTTLHAAEKVLQQRKLLPPSAKVVFITDILTQGHRNNSHHVHVVE